MNSVFILFISAFFIFLEYLRAGGCCGGYEISLLASTVLRVGCVVSIGNNRYFDDVIL